MKPVGDTEILNEYIFHSNTITTGNTVLLPKCLVCQTAPKSFCKNYGKLFAKSDNRINVKYKYNK